MTDTLDAYEELALPEETPAVGRRISERAIGYFCLTGLVALALMLGMFGYASFERAVDDAAGETRDVSFFLADHAGRLFESAELALGEAAAVVGEQRWEEVENSPATYRALSRLSDRFPFVDALSLSDETGRTRAVSTTAAVPEVNNADRSYFRAQLAPATGLFISERVQSRITGRPAFVLSRRLTGPDGAFRGVAAVIIDLRYFDEFYRSLNLNHDPSISLYRENLDVLVRHQAGAPAVDEQKNLETMVAQARQQETPSEFRLDTASQVHSLRKVAGVPVYVSVAIQRDDVGAAWWWQSRIFAVTGAAALLAMAVLTWFAFRHARLVEHTKRELEARVLQRTSDLESAKSQLEVLFKEVHHRVKNNMQVISSMLRLQATRTPDGEMKALLHQGIERVHAMSLVHEQLYNTEELASLDFRAYLRTLAEQLRTSFGAEGRVAIEVDASDIHFDLNTAIPLALIVNEVLSNALKYAFPNGADGRIFIALKEAGGTIELAIIDDGVGLKPGLDWRKADGLGLQIVRSLAGKLRGTPNLSSMSGGGSRFSIRFPRPKES